MAREKQTPSVSLQDKLNQLKTFCVQQPLQHEIPSLEPEMKRMMYWGITYTKQLHAWLNTLMWEFAPTEQHPDICFIELYINFKLVTGGHIP